MIAPRRLLPLLLALGACKSTPEKTIVPPIDAAPDAPEELVWTTADAEHCPLLSYWPGQRVFDLRCLGGRWRRRWWTPAQPLTEHPGYARPPGASIAWREWGRGSLSSDWLWGLDQDRLVVVDRDARVRAAQRWPLAYSDGTVGAALPGGRLLALYDVYTEHEWLSHSMAVFDVRARRLRKDLIRYASFFEASPEVAGEHLSLAVSPDGTRVAGWRCGPEADRPHVISAGSAERCSEQLDVVDVASGKVIHRARVARTRGVAWSADGRRLLLGSPLEILDPASGRIVARGGDGKAPIAIDANRFAAIRPAELVILDSELQLRSRLPLPFSAERLSVEHEPPAGAYLVAVGNGASLPLVRFVRLSDGRALNVGCVPGYPGFWFADDGSWDAVTPEVRMRGRVAGGITVQQRDPTLWSRFWSGHAVPRLLPELVKPRCEPSGGPYSSTSGTDCDAACATCFASIAERP